MGSFCKHESAYGSPSLSHLASQDAPNAARLYWIAGMVLQAGSFCGSVASWPKVAGLQPPEFQPLAMAPL